SNGHSPAFHLPYLVLGGGMCLFAAGIFFSRLPALKPAAPKGFTLTSIVRESRKYPQLFWGAIAMFFYMGAEACTAGFFINYLSQESIAGFSADQTARFLSYYYIASTVVSL